MRESHMRMTMLCPPPSSVTVPEQQTTSDRWFAALDQRMIHVGAERWHAHVVGIHGEGGELWIQIVPAHQPDRGVVVHCWHMQAIDEVIAALRTARVGSGQSMQIVETLRVM